MKALASALFACLALLLNPAVADTSKPPAVVKHFYHWYLQELRDNRDPLDNRQGQLEHGVAAKLASTLARQLQGDEPLDEDYFLKAQDFLDSWTQHQHVQLQESSNDESEVLLTLGTAQEQWPLRVRLVQQEGQWRIREVQKP